MKPGPLSAWVSLSVLVWVALCSPLPTRAAEPPDSTGATPAPVVLYGDTLFVIRAPLGPFTAEERAGAASARLAQLTRQRTPAVDSLTVIDGETSSDILSGDRIVFTITDLDARLAGEPRVHLARRLAVEAYTTIRLDARRIGLRSLLTSALLALVCSIALVVLYLLLRRFFRRAVALLHAWRGTRIRPVHFQNVEVLSADRIADMFTGLVRIVRAITYVILFYLFLPLILSFFPWTREISGKLINYVLSPLKEVGIAVINYLPNIVFIAIIVVVTRYVLRVIAWFFTEVEKGTISLPDFYREWAMPTYRILRVFVLAFASVVVFPYLPFANSPAFKGISVFLGVLFSLGSAASISNMIAGVVLTYMRAFSVGDRVQIADTTGDVIEKTLLVTRVRTIKNVNVTVPNALVLGSHIINFSSSAAAQGLILHTSVTIGYNTPWKTVHELLIAAANATDNVLKQPAPFVLQTSLDDSYVSYEINAYTDKPNAMAMTLSELHRHIQDQFNEAGVEIMSPRYAAIRDGNPIAIPDPYLPRSYRAPGFRINPWSAGTRSPEQGDK